jgi:hypothetical protein
MEAKNMSNRTRCVSRGDWLCVFGEAEELNGTEALQEK